MNNYRLYYKKLSWYDPERVFLALYADKKYTFWLDNNMNQPDQYSYMGIANKRLEYTLSNHTLSISDNIKTQKSHQSIFTYLQKELSSIPYNLSPITYPLPFTGGFIGYFGYEMGKELIKKTQISQTLFIKGGKGDFPDSYFFFVDKFIAFDHSQKCLYLVAISEDKKGASRWLSTTKCQLSKIPVIARSPAQRDDEAISLNNGIAALPSVARNDKKKPITLTFFRSRRQYLKDIRACQKYITAGEVYQICLTNQITANIKTNWIALYRNLRKINPSPLSAFINFGNFALLSSSPEQFLKVDKKGWVTSKPIKGTVGRGNTPEKDLFLAKNLGKTQKDYAENIMIVDLVRNDLGKICKFGSIKVTKPLEVQTYATLHQLVSTIKGKLHPGTTIIDLVRACFPGGSMTGAPKIRAMQILEELEKAPRGIYSGAFGFLSLNGTTNLVMTIRSVVASKDQLSFGTGGSVLSDSITQQEYNEMLLKAQALIAAIKKTAF